ncbi:replication protein [Citrobacter sp. CK205]|uniref:replication protein n=1 Tax=Citrobacter sp. CK205 TaxID=2985114 RepID=UPI0025766E32|nr:replication protein [Citrobacter sp. CK205]MDM3131273.1 replication protein [Citrobacter sp. CK205]
MENQKTGYIPLYRSILKQPWAKDVYLRTLWENLLLNAARKPYTANFKGHVWPLDAGQLVTTSADLGLTLCDRNGEPVSRHAVERMLTCFEKEGMISVHAERRKGTLITILNYAEYAQKNDDLPAHNTAHIPAHNKSSNGEASGCHAAHNTAHIPAHHEQEGTNKNINNKNTQSSCDDRGPGKPERRKPVVINYDEYLQAYNEIVGDRLPHAVEANEERKRKIRKLVNSLATKNIDGFRAYVKAFMAAARPFHFGDNDRDWVANFDYLLRPKVLVAIREGTL